MLGLTALDFAVLKCRVSSQAQTRHPNSSRLFRARMDMDYLESWCNGLTFPRGSHNSCNNLIIGCSIMQLRRLPQRGAYRLRSSWPRALLLHGKGMKDLSKFDMDQNQRRLPQRHKAQCSSRSIAAVLHTNCPPNSKFSDKKSAFDTPL